MNHRVFLSSGIPLVTGLFLFAVAGISHAACDDPPAPNVDWQGCTKTGLQLQNADLRMANLKGINLNFANLEGANLSNADLTGASLLGVNFEGANLREAIVISAFMTKSRIGGTLLENGIFDNSYWVNGQQCMVGSTGLCKFK